MLTAFSTASSNATLPTALKVAEEKLELPPHVSRFVLTIGSTANQNGTALFEGVTVLFLAQFYGVELTLAQQLIVVGICVLGGIGTAGVPAGSLPVVALILGMVGVPPEGIGMILGVDRFLDMCRTTLNVSGDLAAAVVVAKEEEAAFPPPPMGETLVSMSWDEAVAAVTGPGRPFEVVEAEVLGRRAKVFENAPPSLRALFDTARARGDATFLVYEDERWSFAEVMARRSTPSPPLLVERYGVAPGRPRRHRHAQLPRVGRSPSPPSPRSARSPCRSTPGGPTDELDYGLRTRARSVLIADRERAERADAAARHARRAACSPCARAGALPAGVDRWEDVRRRPARRCPTSTSTPTTTPRSSTPRAPPATRRARCRPTGRCCTALLAFACRAAVERPAWRRRADASRTRTRPRSSSIVPLFHVTGCVPVMLVVLRRPATSS